MSLLRHFPFVCAILLPFIFSACESNPDADVEGIDVSIDFYRTDSLLWSAARAIQQFPPDQLTDYQATAAVIQEHLQPERDYFFEFISDGRYSPDTPTSIQDSIISLHFMSFLQDSNTYFLLDTIQQAIPYQYPIADRLLYPLKRFVKYFPDIEIPAFRTHVSGYSPDGHPASLDQTDYSRKFASLGLHYFLGENTRFYSPNIPQFVRRKFDMNFLEVVLAHDLAEGVIRRLDPGRENRLLDQMIYDGVKLYTVKKLLPHTPDSMLLNYSSGQMLWAELYEVKIYNELMPNLYNTDLKMINDYTGQKPYTTHLTIESAPRIGQYAGWKIVDAYMRKNKDIELAKLCQQYSPEEILRDAKYKP